MIIGFLFLVYFSLIFTFDIMPYTRLAIQPIYERTLWICAYRIVSYRIYYQPR